MSKTCLPLKNEQSVFHQGKIIAVVVEYTVGSRDKYIVNNWPLCGIEFHFVRRLR